MFEEFRVLHVKANGRPKNCYCWALASKKSYSNNLQIYITEFVTHEFLIHNNIDGIGHLS